MLEIKFFEWLAKTFGSPKHGYLIELVKMDSEKTDKKNGKKYLIQELKINFQNRNYSEELIKYDPDKWEKEINEWSENSVRKYHCEISNIHSSEMNIQKRGKNLLLIINIFHKQEI